MFSPDFQNWSFLKNYLFYCEKLIYFLIKIIYVRLHKQLWCSLGMTTIIEGGEMLALHGR